MEKCSHFTSMPSARPAERSACISSVVMRSSAAPLRICIISSTVFLTNSPMPLAMTPPANAAATFFMSLRRSSVFFLPRSRPFVSASKTKTARRRRRTPWPAVAMLPLLSLGLPIH